VEPLANIRTRFDAGGASDAMDVFMDEGVLSSHLRRMRAVYRDKTHCIG
jgi:hypothetical protein